MCLLAGGIALLILGWDAVFYSGVKGFLDAIGVIGLGGFLTYEAITKADRIDSVRQ
jgi:hypothetical protein